jgi:hypothetical protein
MRIIDDRGRVFGRLNLVDAAVGVLVLVLLPAAYGAYLLFKDPVPKLTAVVPSVLPQGPDLMQVEVRGENFRPYMRVSFNDVQGRTFLFYNPKSAFVQLLDLPPGKYDVVLYDYMQEVSRLPAAFTVEPRPARPAVRSAMATVRVRFVVSPEVVGLLKRADEDLGARAHPADQTATLVSFTEKGEANASMLRDERVRQAIPTGRLVMVEGVLTVPVMETSLGWKYKGGLVKVGAPFSFETAAYTMDGGVIEVTVPEADLKPR